MPTSGRLSERKGRKCLIDVRRNGRTNDRTHRLTDLQNKLTDEHPYAKTNELTTDGRTDGRTNEGRWIDWLSKQTNEQERISRDRQTNEGQTDQRSKRRTMGHTDGLTSERTKAHTSEPTNGRTNKRTTNKRMNEQINVYGGDLRDWAVVPDKVFEYWEHSFVFWMQERSLKWYIVSGVSRLATYNKSFPKYSKWSSMYNS